MRGVPVSLTRKRDIICFVRLCTMLCVGVGVGLGIATAQAQPAAGASQAGSAATVALTPPRTVAALTPCRLPGLDTTAQCGVLSRPLDPAQPQGTRIDLHYAVIPALARNKHPDPVFFFAGGPGQSAITLAGSAGRLLSRLGQRRDLVFIDQRGTGRSAPLQCAELPATAPLAASIDPAAQRQRLEQCRQRLQKLPHGDLRHYTTWVAMQDAEAVRLALGAPQVNVVGGSYGTRAALEFQRQFPNAVRRSILDGVAPPDMVLPESFAADSQAALDAVFVACAAEPACRAQHPQLRAQWQGLLASLPREVVLKHPTTGLPERVLLQRDAVLSLVRGPLYRPSLAAALPLALSQAAAGQFDALLGLASAIAGRRGMELAEGMHFSVVCSEDVPRMAAASASASVDAPSSAPATPPAIIPASASSSPLTSAAPSTFSPAVANAQTTSPDFGSSQANIYRDACASWPRGAVPAAFYTVPLARSATLLLSGGADPATPPRHAERTARALGALAKHVLVAQAGHGVMSLPCMRDVLFRFIDAADDAAALAVETQCASGVPRPGAFLGLRPEAAASASKP
jgi:pimeloyl-ACP methyl ester carboxylesterase